MPKWKSLEEEDRAYEEAQRKRMERYKALPAEEKAKKLKRVLETLEVEVGVYGKGQCYKDIKDYIEDVGARRIAGLTDDVAGVLKEFAEQFNPWK